MVIFRLFAEFGVVSRDCCFTWWFFRLFVEFGVVSRDCGLAWWYIGCLFRLVLFRAIVIRHGGKLSRLFVESGVVSRDCASI